MSTKPLSSPLPANASPRLGPPAQAQAPASDVHRTRQRIKLLVREITDLAESADSEKAFWQGFLERVLAALAGSRGVLWRGDRSGPKLACQVQVRGEPLELDPEKQPGHAQMIARVLQTGTAALVPPHEKAVPPHEKAVPPHEKAVPPHEKAVPPHEKAGQPDAAFNPTDQLLLLCPVKVNRQAVAVVEVFQRASSSEQAQRGYATFLAQVCKAAERFLQDQRLQQLGRQRESWRRLEAFVTQVHASLETQDTVFSIANEGSRVVGCDRLSVLLPHGGRFRVQAVRGADSLEPRSAQMKNMARLASAVAGRGELLDATPDAVPQSDAAVDGPLRDYLTCSGARRVLVIPLTPGAGDPPARVATRRVLGVLVLEQLSDVPADWDPQSVQQVCRQSALALDHSLQYQRIFLGSLRRWIGDSPPLRLLRNLPVALATLLAAACLIIVLTVFPLRFDLAASGKLVPDRRHEIFAQVDGVLQEILVPEDPQALVAAGQPLAVMTNNDLQVEIQNLRGQLSQAGERVKKLQRAQHSRMDPVEHRLLEGDLAEAIESQASLQRQLDLALQKAERLTVRAPADGRVVDWQVRKHLLRRPVQRGQSLMTIVDPQTDWLVDLQLPERRVGHLLQAMQEHPDQPLPVTLILASHPGRPLHGKVQRVAETLQPTTGEGNCLRVRVAFASQQIDPQQLRGGTRVQGQIHVGTRSAGYVWFHEFLEGIYQWWTLCW